MSAAETTVVDGDAEEIGVELVHATTLAVTPSVKASELVERLDVIRDAMLTAMKPDVDYGVIPGTGSKPTLLKPGAEKLGVLFQLDIQLDNVQTWDGTHLTVTSKAIAFHSPSGSRLGSGEGMCSTRERKYAYRKQERTCPECKVAAIIKGRAEYGGGWVCFKKKGGCGAKFADADVAITGQVVGDVENPDLPDQWNTVLKMAEKRARIDVVLAVTGASALFTQDIEDNPTPEPPPVEPVAPAMTAEVPRPAGRAATAKQRGLINVRASEATLSASQLANLLLAATDNEPREFDDDAHAQNFVGRALDRLPANAVDKVLVGIAEVTA